MNDPLPIPRGEKEPIMDSATASTETGGLGADSLEPNASPNRHATSHNSHTSPTSYASSSGDSPRASRNPSFSQSSAFNEDWEGIPPLDRLSMFDLLNNFALPLQFEKLERNIKAGTEKVMKQSDALRSRGNLARDKVVEEWRRRVPTADEQLEKYRKRMKRSVDKLGEQWNDTRSVTVREKVSFIGGVLDIFISGYLIGARPEWFHLWYTAQLAFFMPIRFYTYKKRGFHYFLADLCYFVNLLLLLSIWVFPNSKRLFISTYCLAFGNNAVAIAMWRNSLVFHSLDKVTSLFIHIMPCVTLHCLVHLLPPTLRAARFPAIEYIVTSDPSSPQHYGLASMALWSSLPYMIWQSLYHVLITVRRREKIAAGRPTSFTWLRKSYAKTALGRIVLGLPEVLQEPAFMFIQYAYALLTMLPCPVWFWYRWASAAFLMAVFCWSVYNGATFYIDVFGNRFQKELEAMRREVAKMGLSPELHGDAGGGGKNGKEGREGGKTDEEKQRMVNVGESANSVGVPVDKIPLLSPGTAKGVSSARDAESGVAKERKGGNS